MAYHSFYDDDGQPYGSCEVFYTDRGIALDEPAADGDLWSGAGWYWWPCFPGCLPDDGPSGPFATEREAMEDAQCVPPPEMITCPECNGEPLPDGPHVATTTCGRCAGTGKVEKP